jgi:hypothetical protein
MNFINGFVGVFNSTMLGEMVAIGTLLAITTVAIAIFTSMVVDRMGLK